MSSVLKPHLLHVRINASWPDSPKYILECPYRDVTDGSNPCASWKECEVHPRPREPEVAEPDLAHGETWPEYVPDADPEAVKVWKEFWEDHAAWEELHDGLPVTDGAGYHPEPGTCWPAEMVEEFAPDDGWRFHVDLDDLEIVSPIKVGVVNDGSFDDTLLILTKWTDE